MAEDDLDCRRCGACCANSLENREEDFRDYVEVKRREPLARRPELLARLAVVNRKGETHLRLVGRQQRCIALQGVLGKSVRCTIYELRPRACRRVEKGSEECRERRRERRLR